MLQFTYIDLYILYMLQAPPLPDGHGPQGPKGDPVSNISPRTTVANDISRKGWFSLFQLNFHHSEFSSVLRI